QLNHIRDLGGLMGIGYENSRAHVYPEIADVPSYVSSAVEDNCAGTSKSVAQHYLYAVEHMHGRQLALGTDSDGLVAAPGPRFGPQSAFALEDDNDPARYDEIGDQHNGVLYEPKYGLPLTTPMFVGKGVDMSKDTDKPQYDKGYRYNKDQSSFFPAIRIFLWK